MKQEKENEALFNPDHSAVVFVTDVIESAPKKAKDLVDAAKKGTAIGSHKVLATIWEIQDALELTKDSLVKKVKQAMKK